MKQRLMRKNTVELAWWVVVAIGTAIWGVTLDLPNEWLQAVVSIIVLVLAFLRIEDHWRQL